MRKGNDYKFKSNSNVFQVSEMNASELRKLNFMNDINKILSRNLNNLTKPKQSRSQKTSHKKVNIYNSEESKGITKKRAKNIILSDMHNINTGNMNSNNIIKTSSSKNQSNSNSNISNINSTRYYKNNSKNNNSNKISYSNDNYFQELEKLGATNNSQLEVKADNSLKNNTTAINKISLLNSNRGEFSTPKNKKSSTVNLTMKSPVKSNSPSDINKYNSIKSYFYMNNQSSIISSDSAFKQPNNNNDNNNNNRNTNINTNTNTNRNNNNNITNNINNNNSNKNRNMRHSIFKTPYRKKKSVTFRIDPNENLLTRANPQTANEEFDPNLVDENFDSYMNFTYLRNTKFNNSMRLINKPPVLTNNDTNNKLLNSQKEINKKSQRSKILESSKDSLLALNEINKEANANIIYSDVHGSNNTITQANILNNSILQSINSMYSKNIKHSNNSCNSYLDNLIEANPHNTLRTYSQNNNRMNTMSYKYNKHNDNNSNDDSNNSLFNSLIRQRIEDSSKYKSKFYNSDELNKDVLEPRKAKSSDLVLPILKKSSSKANKNNNNNNHKVISFNIDPEMRSTNSKNSLTVVNNSIKEIGRQTCMSFGGNTSSYMKNSMTNTSRNNMSNVNNFTFNNNFSSRVIATNNLNNSNSNSILENSQHHNNSDKNLKDLNYFSFMNSNNSMNDTSQIASKDINIKSTYHNDLINKINLNLDIIKQNSQDSKKNSAKPSKLSNSKRSQSERQDKQSKHSKYSEQSSHNYVVNDVNDESSSLHNKKIDNQLNHLVSKQETMTNRSIKNPELKDKIEKSSKLLKTLTTTPNTDTKNLNYKRRASVYIKVAKANEDRTLDLPDIREEVLYDMLETVHKSSSVGQLQNQVKYVEFSISVLLCLTILLTLIDNECYISQTNDYISEYMKNNSIIYITEDVLKQVGNREISAQENGLRITNTCLSVGAFTLLYISYYFQSNIEKLSGIKNPTDGLFNSFTIIGKFFVESVICLFHMPAKLNISFTGTFLGYYWTYNLNAMISLCNIIKFYFIINIILHMSRWTSDTSYSVCRKNLVRPGLVFSIKCEFKNKPFIFLSIIFLCFIVLCSFFLRTFEFGVNSPTDTDFSGNNAFQSLANCFYFIVFSLTGVGYGDIIPKSLLGRIIACVVCIFGQSIVALFIACIAVITEFTYGEKKAHKILMKLTAESNLKEKAAAVIKNIFLMRKVVSKKRGLGIINRIVQQKELEEKKLKEEDLNKAGEEGIDDSSEEVEEREEIEEIEEQSQEYYSNTVSNNMVSNISQNNSNNQIYNNGVNINNSMFNQRNSDTNKRISIETLSDNRNKHLDYSDEDGVRNTTTTNMDVDRDRKHEVMRNNNMHKSSSNNQSNNLIKEALSINNTNNTICNINSIVNTENINRFKKPSLSNYTNTDRLGDHSYHISNNLNENKFNEEVNKENIRKSGKSISLKLKKEINSPDCLETHFPNNSSNNKYDSNININKDSNKKSSGYNLNKVDYTNTTNNNMSNNDSQVYLNKLRQSNILNNLNNINNTNNNNNQNSYNSNNNSSDIKNNNNNSKNNNMNLNQSNPSNQSSLSKSYNSDNSMLRSLKNEQKPTIFNRMTKIIKSVLGSKKKENDSDNNTNTDKNLNILNIENNNNSSGNVNSNNNSKGNFSNTLNDNIKIVSKKSSQSNLSKNSKIKNYEKYTQEDIKNEAMDIEESQRLKNSNNSNNSVNSINSIKDNNNNDNNNNQDPPSNYDSQESQGSKSNSNKNEEIEELEEINRQHILEYLNFKDSSKVDQSKIKTNSKYGTNQNSSDGNSYNNQRSSTYNKLKKSISDLHSNLSNDNLTNMFDKNRNNRSRLSKLSKRNSLKPTAYNLKKYNQSTLINNQIKFLVSDLNLNKSVVDTTLNISKRFIVFSQLKRQVHIFKSDYKAAKQISKPIDDTLKELKIEVKENLDRMLNTLQKLEEISEDIGNITTSQSDFKSTIKNILDMEKTITNYIIHNNNIEHTARHGLLVNSNKNNNEDILNNDSNNNNYNNVIDNTSNKKETNNNAITNTNTNTSKYNDFNINNNTNANINDDSHYFNASAFVNNVNSNSWFEDMTKNDLMNSYYYKKRQTFENSFDGTLAIARKGRRKIRNLSLKKKSRVDLD